MCRSRRGLRSRLLASIDVNRFGASIFHGLVEAVVGKRVNRKMVWAAGKDVAESMA